MRKALIQLARIRLNVGLQQAELAKRAGFVQQYISLLERGLPPTEEAHAERLATALGVPVDTLSATELYIDVSGLTSTVTFSTSKP